jgi:Concanavalin A-like lectin/glucanases superfamily
MTDLERSIREAAGRHDPPADWLERIERRARTRRRNHRILAVIVGLGVSLALVIPLVLQITSEDVGLNQGGRPAAPGSTCSVSVPVTNWWRWDGSGEDVVGGQDAELVGDASFEPGLIGRALTLDGDGDFAVVADDPAVEFGNDDFTFLLWVRFDRTSGGEQIVVEKWVQRRVESSRGWSFAKPQQGQGAFGLYVTSDAGLDGAGSDTLQLSEDTWIHFAVQRRGGTIRIFLNGSVVVEDATITLGDLATASSVKFGHRGGSSDTPGATLEQGNFLEGQLDEVMFVVGRALSIEQIETIYQEQLACSR